MSEKRVVGPHEELTYRIIGAAMAVHRRLGPGYREAVYQRALGQEFADREVGCEPQKMVEVYDNEALVGLYYLDFLVEEKVIVEIKALRGLDNSHLAQVITYLTATDCPIGLLINFGERSLRHRRVFPSPDAVAHRINRQWLFVPDWLKPQLPSDIPDSATTTDRPLPEK